MSGVNFLGGSVEVSLPRKDVIKRGVLRKIEQKNGVVDWFYVIHMRHLLTILTLFSC